MLMNEYKNIQLVSTEQLTFNKTIMAIKLYVIILANTCVIHENILAVLKA